MERNLTIIIDSTKETDPADFGSQKGFIEYVLNEINRTKVKLTVQVYSNQETCQGFVHNLKKSIRNESDRDKIRSKLDLLTHEYSTTTYDLNCVKSLVDKTIVDDLSFALILAKTDSVKDKLDVEVSNESELICVVRSNQQQNDHVIQIVDMKHSVLEIQRILCGSDIANEKSKLSIIPSTSFMTLNPATSTGETISSKIDDQISSSSSSSVRIKSSADEQTEFLLLTTHTMDSMISTTVMETSPKQLSSTKTIISSSKFNTTVTSFSASNMEEFASSTVVEIINKKALMNQSTESVVAPSSESPSASTSFPILLSSYRISSNQTNQSSVTNLTGLVQSTVKTSPSVMNNNSRSLIVANTTQLIIAASNSLSNETLQIKTAVLPNATVSSRLRISSSQIVPTTPILSPNINVTNITIPLNISSSIEPLMIVNETLNVNDSDSVFTTPASSLVVSSTAVVTENNYTLNSSNNLDKSSNIVSLSFSNQTTVNSISPSSALNISVTSPTSVDNSSLSIRDKFVFLNATRYINTTLQSVTQVNATKSLNVSTESMSVVSNNDTMLLPSPSLSRNLSSMFEIAMRITNHSTSAFTTTLKPSLQLNATVFMLNESVLATSRQINLSSSVSTKASSFPHLNMSININVSWSIPISQIHLSSQISNTTNSSIKIPYVLQSKVDGNASSSLFEIAPSVSSNHSLQSGIEILPRNVTSNITVFADVSTVSPSYELTTERRFTPYSTTVEMSSMSSSLFLSSKIVTSQYSSIMISVPTSKAGKY